MVREIGATNAWDTAKTATRTIRVYMMSIARQNIIDTSFEPKSYDKKIAKKNQNIELYAYEVHS